MVDEKSRFKERSGNWGSLGGNTKMFPFRGVGTQQPGQTAQEGNGGRRDQTAKGGAAGVASQDNSKHGRTMSAKPSGNRDYAGTQSPGTTAATKSGGDSRFAEGGTTKMFGNRGSQRAIPGQTGPSGG
jgi:hypothetical protein